jgi:CheY-like chemotaxis protein
MLYYQQKGDRTMKNLVIDDEPELRERFQKILEDAGHLICEASGANEVLRDIEALLSYDLIVTDMRMPNGTGLHFLQGYRRIRRFPVPVLVHSSSDNFRDRDTPMLYLPEEIPKMFPFAEYRSKKPRGDHILDFVERHTP